jgi:gliding motility-associated-like protein
MRPVTRICGFLLALFSSGCLSAQNYTPITVTGFNHDVFAEATPSSTATTDTVLDATSHVMYTQAFATAAGVGGGIPNTGLISDASNTHVYQLAGFSGANALTLVRNVSRPLLLATPASYSRLSLLSFSTEGSSTVSVSVRFTDGSTTTYIAGSSLADWFNSSTNLVTSGFGRIIRSASAPYSVDGLSTNPRFYYIDFALSCADQLKTVAQVNLANTTSTGTNAPFPNAVFLALSGITMTQAVVKSATPATCSAANGTATVTVTGSASPFAITWNSSPAQSGPTASGLAAGSYTATITNALGCASTQTVTVPQQGSTVAVTASAAAASICNSESTQLSVSATGGTLTTYTWTPGNLSGLTVTVTPTVTTTYTVSGNDQYGCSYSKNVTVNVNPLPAAVTVAAVSVCAGNAATLVVQNPVAGETYNWYSTASGGSAAGSGTSFQTPILNSNATYYVEAVSGAGCVQPTRNPATVTVNPTPATPAASGVAICPGAQATLNILTPIPGETYSWYAAASGGTPVATGTSYQTAALTATTTYYFDAASASGCISTARGSVTVTVNPAPAIPAATGATICAGTTSSLSVQSPVAGEVYNWYSTASGGSQIATGTVYITPVLSSSTTYYVEAISASGCVQAARGTAVVTVNPLPATPSGLAAPICTGALATLNVTAPVAGETYSWYAVAAGGTTLGSGTTYQTPALNATTTYYLEAASGAGCISASRAAVTVTVNAAPAAPSLGALSVCPGAVATFTIPSPQAGAVYDWYAGASGGTILNTGSSFQTPPVNTAVTYYIAVTNSSGCVSAVRGTAPVTLLQPLPAPVLSIAALTSSSVTFSWNAVPGATGYEVSMDAGATFITPSSGASGTTHTIGGLLPGARVAIQVRALGASTCETSALSGPLSAIIPDKNLFVPNVFTPNGDGRNDVLYVFSNSIASMTFRIFNQWGNEVFVSTDAHKGWDGTWQGQLQPVGVYVYVLRVRLYDGTELQKKGSISLVR